MAIGRRVYGLGTILTGAVGIWFRLMAGHPAHPLAHTSDLLILGGDALLILGGVAISLGRRTAAIGALVLAAYFAVAAAVEVGPTLARQWKVWVTWQGLAEAAAMSMGGLLAWSLLGERGDALRRRAGEAARLVFGLCLLVFGISHFVYLKFTVAMVPGWIPPSQTFWAYATGAAQFAAGMAVLSGVRAQLAAMLLTTMYVGFGLLVHLPAVIRDPHNRMSWSENDVNLVLVGAAWCLAEWMSRRRAAK
jgi:uncharacterized membrane protein YphA (DoxX/SURF4 family)